MLMLTREDAKELHERNPKASPWVWSIFGILSAQTDKTEARAVLEDILIRYPTPQELAEADDELCRLMVGLNLGHRRCRTVLSFARKWVKDDWHNLLDLPGVSQGVMSIVQAALIECLKRMS